MELRKLSMAVSALVVGALALSALGSTSSDSALIASYSAVQHSPAVRLRATIANAFSESQAPYSLSFAGVFNRAKHESQQSGEITTSGRGKPDIYYGGYYYLYIFHDSGVQGLSKAWIKTPVDQYLAWASSPLLGYVPSNNLGVEEAVIKATIDSRAAVTPNHEVNDQNATEYSAVVSPADMRRALMSVEPSVAAHIKYLKGLVSTYHCSVWVDGARFPIKVRMAVHLRGSHEKMTVTDFLSPLSTAVTVEPPPASRVQLVPSFSAFGNKAR